MKLIKRHIRGSDEKPVYSVVELDALILKRPARGRRPQKRKA